MLTRLNEMEKEEMITADTISRHEFIGLNTQIINSNNLAS